MPDSIALLAILGAWGALIFIWSRTHGTERQSENTDHLERR